MKRTRTPDTIAIHWTDATTSTTGSATIPNIRVGPSTDFVEHVHEVEVRLDACAGIAAQALLGEIDRDHALEALIGMLEISGRHLRAAVGM